jgi:hypothetical protein
MKLTEAKLKSLIREVLQEAAIAPSDLPSEVYVMVEKISEDEISVDYTNADGIQLKFNKEGEPYGTVIVDTSVQMGEEFPCSNAMMVAFSDASDGWGPLIYDVAMEVATLLAGGLVADRTNLSPDAYDVWDYYHKKRKDVNGNQLDNEDGELTPDMQADDCLQTTTYDYTRKTGDHWTDSPISKVYKKDPTTLKTLRDSGKLILKDINLNF